MTNELTVRVERPELPALRWNRDEVEQNLTEMLSAYTGRVYTPESITDAKKDRAKVNKLDKQFGEVTASVKAYYSTAYAEFETAVKQMRAQCKQVSGAIDAQVKAVEETEKEEKQAALRLVYEDCIEELHEMLPFERLMLPQWLNKTYDLAKASRELRKSVERRREDLKLIRQTCGGEADACIVDYLKELDINAALHEYQRRKEAMEQQRRAEAQRQAAERAKAAAPVIIPPSEEERQIKAEAAAEAQASRFITASGRLDCEVLQQFAEPQRKKYSFWVEFTAEDIAWFKQGAAERGFRYGSIK